jgi:xylose isomerase
MSEHFPGISKIQFEGSQSRNPLSFKHYDADEVVLGKTMSEHFRFSVCYWHTMMGLGKDMFGGDSIERGYLSSQDPMTRAHDTLDAAFEFFTKLESNRNLDAIVDRAAQKQAETGVKTLWGTACLFGHPRYSAGAATAPDPAVFAYAAAQVKKAMEVTHRLNGSGFVFWGGREGYDTLLNTDMKREADQLARFLHMAVDYKKEIGFSGQFFIEPKPQEPTKHQYDYDVQSGHAFLQEYGLTEHFQFNIEANHATLAGHTFQHELEYAGARGLLGSIDANRGDYLIGWDTDQFPTDIYDPTLAMLTVVRAGGLTKGGFNFDAKVRRQSFDLEDLFHAHIGGMDSFARGLKNVAKIIEDGRIDEVKDARNAGWSTDFGKQILAGDKSMADLESAALSGGEPKKISGRQELLENLLNEFI